MFSIRSLSVIGRKSPFWKGLQKHFWYDTKRIAPQIELRHFLYNFKINIPLFIAPPKEQKEAKRRKFE